MSFFNFFIECHKAIFRVAWNSIVEARKKISAIARSRRLKRDVTIALTFTCTVIPGVLLLVIFLYTLCPEIAKYALTAKEFCMQLASMSILIKLLLMSVCYVWFWFGLYLLFTKVEEADP